MRAGVGLQNDAFALFSGRQLFCQLAQTFGIFFQVSLKGRRLCIVSPPMLSPTTQRL
jgi:hypothetical protein